MVNERTQKDLKHSPILEEPQVYIYILQNSAGKVKVGITKNIIQRIQSLSGSNGQGNKIIKCYHSPATYLYVIERIMHERMKKCRLHGTEWFYYNEDPSGDILFNSTVELLERLFNSNDYKKCEAIRRDINNELKEKKDGNII